MLNVTVVFIFFFFQAEDGIRDVAVTGVQTCALPISSWRGCRSTSGSVSRAHEAAHHAAGAAHRGSRILSRLARRGGRPAAGTDAHRGRAGGGGDQRLQPGAGARRGCPHAAHRATAPALRPPHAARRRPVRGCDLGRRRPLSGARGEPAHRRARRADPRELRAALHAPQAEDDPQYADRGRAGRPADRGRLDGGRRHDRTGGRGAVLDPVPVAVAPFPRARVDLSGGLPARRPRDAVGHGPRRPSHGPHDAALRNGALAGEPLADTAGRDGRAVFLRGAHPWPRLCGRVRRDDRRRHHRTRLARVPGLDRVPAGAAHAHGVGQDRVIPFHRLLISTAIAFCAGFAVWAGWTYRQSGEALTLVMGLAFAVAAVALVYYLRHLNRFLGR